MVAAAEVVDAERVLDLDGNGGVGRCMFEQATITASTSALPRPARSRSGYIAVRCALVKGL